MKYSFITDLSIDNCENKLKESLIKEKRTGICGKISKHQHTFWIQQKPLNYVNNFQKVFYGKLINCKEKTLIIGSLSISKSLKIFIQIYYGFIMLILGIAIYFSIHDMIIGKSVEIGQVVRGIFLILLVAVVSNVIFTIASKINTSQEQYVIKFLSNKLNAREFNDNN